MPHDDMVLHETSPPRRRARRFRVTVMREFVDDIPKIVRDVRENEPELLRSVVRKKERPLVVEFIFAPIEDRQVQMIIDDIVHVSKLATIEVGDLEQWNGRHAQDKSA